MRVCLHMLMREEVVESLFTYADEGRCGWESVYIC